MNEARQLPDDLDACHELLRSQFATIDSQQVGLAAKDTTLIAMQARIDALHHQLSFKEFEMREWIRRLFVKRSERYLDNPSQLKLDFPDVPDMDEMSEGLKDAIVEADPTSEIVVPEHVRRKRAEKPRNEQLPEHLERYEVESPVPEDVKTCSQHGEKKPIGHDRIETLEFTPPKLRVRVTRIPKFACEGHRECGVTEATRPAGLVEGNRYDTSIAAEVIVAKYGYHLPYYRQQDWFAGSGWCPSRGTLVNIAAAAGELLAPFIAFLKSELLEDAVIGTDDTSVVMVMPKGDGIPPPGDSPKSQRCHEVLSKALEEGKRSITANMWAYRGVSVPLNVFDFTVSRHRDGPDAFLVDTQWTGTLMADCFSGYQGIALRSDERIARAACNAHARRKFFDAKDNHPLLANQFLAFYQQLYDVEDQVKGLSTGERQRLRVEQGEPIWRQMRVLLDGEVASRVLPKEKIREAMNYLENHWIALRRYLDNGALPFDNNRVEQLMKQVAIGRKNWLFIGSLAAGERAANLLTLVSSALRSDLDVFQYVKGVLDALLADTTDYTPLRPDRWAAAHPEQIRAYRQQERRQREEKKTTTRTRRRR